MTDWLMVFMIITKVICQSPKLRLDSRVLASNATSRSRRYSAKHEPATSYSQATYEFPQGSANPARARHDPLHHLTLGNRLVLIPPQKRLLNRKSLANRSVSGDFSSQGALRCVVAVAFSCRSYKLGSFTRKIALATIGLNFALHAVRGSHINCRSARTWDTDACVADL